MTRLQLLLDTLGASEDHPTVRELVDLFGGTPVATDERLVDEPAHRSRRLTFVSGGAMALPLDLLFTPILIAVLFLLHPVITTRPVLFAATLATGAAFAAATPLLETLGVAAARGHGFAYAQARGIGSLGYLGANLIAGAWIARAGSGVSWPACA